MNVHFGSKDFHLSCFRGIAYEKTLPPTPLVSYNKVRGHICMHILASKLAFASLQNEGFVCHQGFQNATPQKICGKLRNAQIPPSEKDACVNCCFAVLSSLVVKIKVWDNIYLIALAWVPV